MNESVKESFTKVSESEESRLDMCKLLKECTCESFRQWVIYSESLKNSVLNQTEITPGVGFKFTPQMIQFDSEQSVNQLRSHQQADTRSDSLQNRI